MATWKTNRKTKKPFLGGAKGARARSDVMESLGEHATYFETSHVHSDPLEAVNEILRAAERQVGTHPHEEIGEIEAYAEGREGDTRPIDLGKPGETYPSRITWSVLLPGRRGEGKNYILGGAINRTNGGWTAGAELEDMEVG